MVLRLTCNNKDCGEVLEADDEPRLVALAQAHARQHGHDRPIPTEHVLARIRRSNPASGPA